MSQDLKKSVVAVALEAGFSAARVTTPDRIGPAGERLRRYLADGRHGEMGWLERNADRRADPRVLWPDVRAIIMLGLSYAPEHDPLDILSEPDRGAISCYAHGRDYHDVIKSRMKEIASQFARDSGAEVKVFVDTAPLMEKPLAQAAGIGWQGKHTNLVSRVHGSWLFLGAILTTADLPPDEPEPDHCGSCRRCLDACPTAAFPAPYQLDARRCIAYLTIEHPGHIDIEFRQAIANRVFGCDDCLAVCPWNKFADTTREMRFQRRAETSNPPLAELLQLDDATFRQRFAGTPIKRTGRNRFMRNVLIAVGNSGDRALLPDVERLASDPSPLVRAMAAWAAWRLCDRETFHHMSANAIVGESDPIVLAEWTRERPQ